MTYKLSGFLWLHHKVHVLRTGETDRGAQIVQENDVDPKERPDQSQPELDICSKKTMGVNGATSTVHLKTYSVGHL